MSDKILKKYKIEKQVYEGLNSAVFIAENIESREKVAIKRVIINGREAETQKKRLKRETEITSKISHENIIKLHEFSLNCENILVFEFIECTLSTISLSHEKIINFSRQILQGLVFLHSQNIYHRDIKPSNILVTHTNCIKIADFGLARYVNREPEKCALQLSYQIQSRWYRSPEILFGSRCYDDKVDMWSFGCLLAEMILNKVLFKGISDIDQIGCIFELIGTPGYNGKNLWDEWVKLPDYGKIVFDKCEGSLCFQEVLQGWDEKIVVVLEKCFVYDRFQRISSKDALNIFISL